MTRLGCTQRWPRPRGLPAHIDHCVARLAPLAEPALNNPRCGPLLIMSGVPKEKKAQGWSVIGLPAVKEHLSLQVRRRLKVDHMTPR